MSTNPSAPRPTTLMRRNLRTLVLRRLGRTEEAATFLEETRALDPLDIFVYGWRPMAPPKDNQLLLDLAFDLARGRLPGRSPVDAHRRKPRHTRQRRTCLTLSARRHT